MTASQLHKQDKDVQVGTLTLAFGPDTLNLLNTLPYASDADKEDPEKYWNCWISGASARRTLSMSGIGFAPANNTKVSHLIHS